VSSFADLASEEPEFALRVRAAFDADAKLAGRATEVTSTDERGRHAAAAGIPPEHMGFELFRIDLDQVVLVGLNDEKDTLIVSSWWPGRGLTCIPRT
jgi:hypothetical protein